MSDNSGTTWTMDESQRMKGLARGLRQTRRSVQTVTKKNTVEVECYNRPSTDHRPYARVKLAHSHIFLTTNVLSQIENQYLQPQP